MTSEPTIAGIGQSLGRGTILSMLLVLFVLPQILLIGSKVIDKTSFAVPKVLHRAERSGRVVINGVVSGEIRGSVTGVMRATVDGDVNLNVISGDIAGVEEEKLIPDHTGKEADDHDHQ